MKTRGFQYSLRALMRKRATELDQAKAELAAANERLARNERELQARTAQVHEFQKLQRDSSRAGESIDVHSRMRLHECLRGALLRKSEQAAKVEEARAEQEKHLEALRAAREALRALERHEEHALAEFDAAQRRQAQRATDELYLANSSSRP